jgi:DNA-binding Lrp family transcriptional regulator
MQQPSRDIIRHRLLEEWQRAFPLVSRPFAVIASRLRIGEGGVLEILERLQAEGAISRVGGVVRPNTLGASTLAAIAAPELQVGSVAAILSAEPGVNHVYLRENDRNLWFVVTGPDRAYVDQALRRIADRTGYRVLDLRLETPYHIDLGFTLTGGDVHKIAQAEAEHAQRTAYAPHPADRELVQMLTLGLPLIPQPFKHIADLLDRSEKEVIDRLKVLTAAGIVPRIGVIVRHRALGWRANAMVIWDVPPSDVDRAGKSLATAPGINLCYRRTRYPREWPYNLYCMVHARSREEALDKLIQAQTRAGLEAYPRQVLFSLRCYKQTGAMLALPKAAA